MNHAQKLGLAVLLVLYALLPQFLKSYGIYLMSLLCVYLMAAFGLNLIVGYAGQMSIGQAAFYGIGAYTAAILMTKLGMSFWLVLPIAAIICFAIGLA
ncbi:MAG TPA: branched-chain amino acid ABC transporter permease, partial [Casimicrobiaceae bacterium]|nr:branched-chain amino acid ABC transporter permease [Casimicrobiaceae bacterium]